MIIEIKNGAYEVFGRSELPVRATLAVVPGLYIARTFKSATRCTGPLRRMVTGQPMRQQPAIRPGQGRL